MPKVRVFWACMLTVGCSTQPAPTEAGASAAGTTKGLLARHLPFVSRREQ